jgi:hypothetical protein
MMKMSDMERTFIITVRCDEDDDPEMLIEMIMDGVKLEGLSVMCGNLASSCGICDTIVSEDDLTRVMELDGEDKDQPLDIIQVCPSCYKNEVYMPGWGFSNSYNAIDEYKSIVDEDGDTVWSWTGNVSTK